MRLRGLRKKTVGPKVDLREFCDKLVMAKAQQNVAWFVDERGRILAQWNGKVLCPLQLVAQLQFRKEIFDTCYEAGKRIGLPGYLAQDIGDAENNEALNLHAQQARKEILQFLNLNEVEIHAPPP